MQKTQMIINYILGKEIMNSRWMKSWLMTSRTLLITLINTLQNKGIIISKSRGITYKDKDKDKCITKATTGIIINSVWDKEIWHKIRIRDNTTPNKTITNSIHITLLRGNNSIGIKKVKVSI
jgi:hypothetical protein